MSKVFCIITFLIAIVVNCYSQQVDKEVVALQMNSCVMSVVNIRQSQNLTTFLRERDIIMNKLSIEGMVRIPEIASWRKSTLDATGRLTISQEERDFLKKIRVMEKNGAKWQAVSNALNSAMVFVPGKGGGGAQAAFYALLTTARTAVEYGSLQNAGNIEEERALMEIRKRELAVYNDQDTTLFGTITRIFQKYKVPEEYRMDEESAKSFKQLIQVKDASVRIRKLLDMERSYRYFNDYYYYLGMAYCETKDYANADKYFNKYLSNESKSKLYRTDEKAGCIYLAKLGYSKKLTNTQYVNYIDKIVRNLPHSSPAYIQCALVYFTQLKSPEKAVDLLRKALYDDQISDKEAIIMALTRWMPKIKEMGIYHELYKVVCKAIDDNESLVSVNSYLAFLNSCGEKNMWDEINKIMAISGNGDTLEVNPHRTFNVHLYKNLNVDPGSISVFMEVMSDDELFAKEKTMSFLEGYSKKKLQKKFDLFDPTNGFDEMIYFFFDHDPVSNQFFVKRSLSSKDFATLLNRPQDFEAFKETYAYDLDLASPGSKGRKYIKEVAEYCKKHQSESPTHRVLVFGNSIKNEGLKKEKEEKENRLYLDNYSISSKNLRAINIKNLKLNPEEYSRYTYSETVRKFPGSTYHSRMYKAYKGEYIKVQFLGKNADPIYVTYKVDNGVANIVSFQVGNVIRFKNPIKTVAPQKKVNVKVKESATKTTNAAEAAMQKGKNAVKNAVEISKRIVTPNFKKVPARGGSK